MIPGIKIRVQLDTSTVYQSTKEFSNQCNRAGLPIENAGLPIENTARILSVSREKAQQYENGQISVPDLEIIFLRAHADNIVAQRNAGTFRFIDLLRA